MHQLYFAKRLFVQTLKAVSTIHILVNTRNSSSQFKRAKSSQDGRMVGHLHNFIKAKEKMNASFRDLRKYLEDCNKFSADSRIADENEEDINKFSSEVRLSNVAFKLHDMTRIDKLKIF